MFGGTASAWECPTNFSLSWPANPLCAIVCSCLANKIGPNNQSVRDGISIEASLRYSDKLRRSDIFYFAPRPVYQNMSLLDGAGGWCYFDNYKYPAPTEL